MDFIKKMFRTKKYMLQYLICLLVIAILGSLYCFSNADVDKAVSIGGEAYTEDKKNEQETKTDSVPVGLGSVDTGSELYYVYVCGAVNVPGVYQCEAGSRIYELIEKAGGFCENADTDYLNLVETVKDGSKIYVPLKGENAVIDGKTVSLININTATLEQLMTLPGIGESRAKDIISYRQNNGDFKLIEDIKKVSGIKDAAYEKIKDLICV